MRTFPPRNPSRRTLLVGLLIAVASAVASDAFAAANTPGCVPVPDERPRATTTHDGPEPDLALRRAVARLKAKDPDVTVTFNDCEVDSFATRPKPSVPHYAKGILRAAGLPVNRSQIQLLPPPETRPKPAQDLDSPEGLRHKLPLPDEAPPEALPRRHKGDDAAPDDPRPGTPLLEQRTEPAIVLEPRVSTFAPPAPQLVERERLVAKKILLAFLAENEPVFRVGSRQLAAGLPGLHLLDYRVSRFFRAAAFSQSVKGEPVIESRTLALFDANWNVIGITRTLYTPTKLKIQKLSTIPRTRAMAAAIRTVAELTDREPESFEPRTVVLGLDSLRRERVFQVQVVDPKSPEFDFTVLAARGERRGAERQRQRRCVHRRQDAALGLHQREPEAARPDHLDRRLHARRQHAAPRLLLPRDRRARRGPLRPVGVHAPEGTAASRCGGRSRGGRTTARSPSSVTRIARTGTSRSGARPTARAASARATPTTGRGRTSSG